MKVQVKDTYPQKILRGKTGKIISRDGNKYYFVADFDGKGSWIDKQYLISIHKSFFKILNTLHKINLVIKNSVKILNSGILAQQDDLFRKQVKIDYNIEKLKQKTLTRNKSKRIRCL